MPGMVASGSGESSRPGQALHRLRCTVVRGIGYDEGNLRLVLGFRNGTTVEYLGVPRELYDAFIDSQPRSWAAVGGLLRRYRQREVAPVPVSAQLVRRREPDHAQQWQIAEPR